MNENDELEADGPMIAFRGLFLIDKEGIVQHQIVNNLPLGRNVDEALRMVDALQHHEEEGEVCPANWEKGKEAMKENFAGVADYLSKALKISFTQTIKKARAILGLYFIYKAQY